MKNVIACAEANSASWAVRVFAHRKFCVVDQVLKGQVRTAQAALREVFDTRVLILGWVLKYRGFVVV